MQTRSARHIINGSSTPRDPASPRLGPPGVWDRDPLEDATGASLLTELPGALTQDPLLVRAWLGAASRIGAPLVAELDFGGIDPWDNDVRTWLGHVGSWTLARTTAGASMHCWVEEQDLRYPHRLVSRLEELVSLVRARLAAYQGISGQAPIARGDHVALQQRLEQSWRDYRKAQRDGRPARVPAELVELSMRVARHEARRLRPNMPEHLDQSDIEARAVLSVFDAIDEAWRAGSDQLAPRIRRGVRWIVLDELHGEAQLSQEERALLGIDSLKVPLEDIEPVEDDAEVDLGLRPSEPPASNPRWTPCDHLSSNSK